MADAPGVHFGTHNEHEPAHEAVVHQQDEEEELIAAKIAQVALLNCPKAFTRACSERCTFNLVRGF